MTQQESTVREKTIVWFIAFSIACAAFALSVLLLIPIIGGLMQTLQFPDLIQLVVIVVLLFGAPITGAFSGLNLGMKIIQTE